MFSNFTFDALFSCLPIPAAIFWECWYLAANYNATGRLLRKQAWSRNAALDYAHNRYFSSGFDLGWVKHFTLFPWLEPTFLWLDALRNCATLKKKMHGSLMHRKKKNKKLSCWLRLINSSTFQFFTTLLFVLGKWDMMRKKGSMQSWWHCVQCLLFRLTSLLWQQWKDKNILASSHMNTDAQKIVYWIYRLYIYI